MQIKFHTEQRIKKTLELAWTGILFWRICFQLKQKVNLISKGREILHYVARRENSEAIPIHGGSYLIPTFHHCPSQYEQTDSVEVALPAG